MSGLKRNGAHQNKIGSQTLLNHLDKQFFWRLEHRSHDWIERFLSSNRIYVVMDLVWVQQIIYVLLWGLKASKIPSDRQKTNFRSFKWIWRLLYRSRIYGPLENGRPGDSIQSLKIFVHILNCHEKVTLTLPVLLEQNCLTLWKVTRFSLVKPVAAVWKVGFCKISILF